MLWWYILIWRLIGCSYWKLRQIFRRNKYQRRQAVIVSLPTWIGFTKSQRIWTPTIHWNHQNTLLISWDYPFKSSAHVERGSSRSRIKMMQILQFKLQFLRFGSGTQKIFDISGFCGTVRRRYWPWCTVDHSVDGDIVKYPDCKSKIVGLPKTSNTGICSLKSGYKDRAKLLQLWALIY
jgi:hypothetical protein